MLRKNTGFSAVGLGGHAPNYPDKYGKLPNGVLMLDSSCATAVSQLYSRYLDEPALVWDAACNQVYLYRPRPDSSKLAFKGGRWMWSGKLKPEFAQLSIEEVYLELVGKL